jgi:type VI protein secretion system component Hcp
MAEYIWFTGITGPCAKASHEGWIEVTNWGWNCAREASGGNQIGLASGIAKFENLHFEATIGSATIAMFQKMLNGTHFDEVKIECTKNTGGAEPEAWMKVTLKHVLVMSVEQSVESDTANDTVNLSFSQCNVKIADQKGDGSLDTEKEFSYDLTTAKVS